MKIETKKRIRKLVIAAVLLLAGNLLLCFTMWLLSKYDDVCFDQILFQMKSSTEGAHKKLTSSAVFRVGFLGVLFTVLGGAVYGLLSGGLMSKLKNSPNYMKYCSTKVCRFIRREVVPIALIIAIVSAVIFVGELDVVAYVQTVSTESDFIEENYVDPDVTKLTFPKEKRNLVYIILESMETTFSQTEAGEPIVTDYIPELTKLAEENVGFSNTADIGGARMYTGTSWTAGSMVAQTSGMVIKVPLGADNYGGEDAFIPGITSIGEILGKQGYSQTIIMGSDADFAGRRTYFTEHGNYNVLDTKSLKAAGRLPEDYNEWWGFEDRKVFQFAKEELVKLSDASQPFNLTLLTADSHFPDGYVCPLCDDDHENQYANVLSCSSKQVYEFVTWIQQQDFYENTTIIISGDHLTMDPAFLEGIDESYVRTTYNCIINPAAATKYEKNRQYGVFDMFPTTLAAMGVKIDGDRLALGTNLFSGKKTLTETYGYEALDEQLQMRSEFYNRYFLGMYE